MPRSKRDQRQPFRRRNQFASLAPHVFLIDQAFDDGGARRRRSESVGAHRLAQFFVVDEFSRAFHRGEQGRFVETRRRFGLVLLYFDVDDLRGFVLLNGNERRAAVVVRSALLLVRKPPASPDR